MKKTLIVSIFIVFFIALTVMSPVLAVKPNGPAADNGLNKGKSDVRHLELYEKNPMTWEPVIDGAWGKMNFDMDSFVFNGHSLEAGTEYSLIYYPDPWPGNGLQILGTGVTNEDGNVHIKDSFDFTEIPINDDENKGAKIWLVLSDDVAGDHMSGWNPSEYLFEYNILD